MQCILHVPEVALGVVDLDVEMALRIGRLPRVERVHGDVSQIHLLMVAKDVEGAPTGMRIEIQDADGLHFLERLEGGEGQSIKLAETVASITTRMVQAAGQAAGATVLKRLLHGVAHAAG